MGTCNHDETPILVNLQSNGADDQLSSADDGVIFDIFSDGRPVRIAWPRADASVAFLVMDRNNNGVIDDASEMFGSTTRKRDGTVAANGFEALLDLDGGPGISDGRIDSGSPAYSRLRLWRDENHNGFSEQGELMSLSQAGITTLFTSYRETPIVDDYGNRYKYRGSALVLRNGRESERKIFDVVLKWKPLS